MGPDDNLPSGLMTPPDDSEEKILNSPAHAMMNVPDRIIVGGKVDCFDKAKPQIKWEPGAIEPPVPQLWLPVCFQFYTVHCITMSMSFFLK